MPAYKKNSEKNKELKYNLPTQPECEICVPSRLGYRARKEIRSKSYKVHVEANEQGEEKAFQVIDPAEAEHEVLVASLLDPRTYHNLTDENGRPLQLTRYWIDYEMDENDALWLGQMLMAEFGEDIGIDVENDSAEGEVEEEKETKSSTRGKRSSAATQEVSPLP